MLLNPLSSSKSKSLSVSSNNYTRASESTRLNNSYELAESLLYLEVNGRLLMLPILNRERGIKFDKYNHDSGVFQSCIYRWPLCKCRYAKQIRGIDMNFSSNRIEELSEVI